MGVGNGIYLLHKFSSNAGVTVFNENEEFSNRMNLIAQKLNLKSHIVNEKKLSAPGFHRDQWGNLYVNRRPRRPPGK